MSVLCMRMRVFERGELEEEGGRFRLWDDFKTG